MDDNSVLLRRMHRQLRLLNIWLSGFGILLLIALVVIGILLFKLISFTHSAESKLESLQTQASQTLNVKRQICGNSAISSLIQSDDHICQ